VYIFGGLFGWNHLRQNEALFGGSSGGGADGGRGRGTTCEFGATSSMMSFKLKDGSSMVDGGHKGLSRDAAVVAQWWPK